ncbi:GntR family transcriptional regulator [Tindallia magadiensis]|uniref:GntR family transcriptional regulator n=1 Tax=Tindallia magadiensis TaxID=69895 RepID=A0A1I3BZP9_9FIRM|nr:GntR family transcriptional regulator [Tindallia magadiensis]SFH67439.1 GntR family transcriptional regulator [Tindallia magadiensis]
MKIKEKTISLSMQAKGKILEYIQENNLKGDDQLPPESLLMESMGVCRHTVREALALLEQENVIYKVQGKGTFVHIPPISINGGLEKLESITCMIENAGYTPGTQWISIKEDQPTQSMKKKLALSSDESVITFTRLRTANGKPAAYCVDSVPRSMIQGPIPEKVTEESMFQYLEKHYELHPVYAVTEIIPKQADQQKMIDAGMPKNQLLLLLHQVHYNRQRVPLIYSMDYFNPELFKFWVNRTI